MAESSSLSCARQNSPMPLRSRRRTYRSWQAGYAEVISDEFLRGLDSELAGRTLHWQTDILGCRGRRPLRAGRRARG